MTRFRWWTMLLLGTALLAVPMVSADDTVKGGDKAKTEAKESRPVIDETQVYFGAVAGCKAPGVVDADKVFKKIPEYKKICDDGLTDKDPKYTLLLLKATRKFKAAVEAAAQAGGQDLVANVGAVTWEGHVVPDLTDSVLLKLEEAAEGNK